MFYNLGRQEMYQFLDRDSLKCVLLIFCAFSLLQGCYVFAQQKTQHYEDVDKELQYLKTNFNELYKSDYSKFWSILHEGSLGIKNNDPPSEIMSFVDVANVIGGNSEVREFFHEMIEKYCVNNEEYCLELLKTSNGETMDTIQSFLKNPIYFSRDKFLKIIQD